VGGYIIGFPDMTQFSHLGQSIATDQEELLCPERRNKSNQTKSPKAPMKTINQPLSIFAALSLLAGLWTAEAQSPLAPDAQTRALYHFDELGGAIIEDSSFGGTWDGTLLNGAGRGASLFASGTALALDGADDYASASPELLNDLPQGTIEAWVYVESFMPESFSPIITKGSAALTDLGFFVHSTGFVIHGGLGVDGFTVLTPIPLQTWTKVAVTWDGSYRRLYLNDSLVGEEARAWAPANNSVNEVKIGRHNHTSGPQYFHGRIEDLRISEVARVFHPDSDGDGVSDEQDQCPDTPVGSIVDARGCSIAQLVACDGQWKNHGQYVSAVAKMCEQFLSAGLITEEQKDAIVEAAAGSDCGKNRQIY